MEPELEKPKQEDPATSRLVRLVAWLAIYFLGIVVFLADAFALNPSGGTPGFLIICTLVAFPTGLFYFGAAVSGGLSGVTDLPSFIFAALLGYVVYSIHLVITLKVKARRVFWVLLLVLIVLVCMNVVGCSYIGNTRPHM